MSVLRSIESKIEGLFEGVFGRAFRTNVQPVELARRLAKEMDENRSVSVSRVYVPNEYTVYLSPGDREKFVSYEGSLIGELQEYLTEHAARERYALLTPPRVSITTDDDLATGEFGIATRVVQPPAGPALPPLAEPVAPPEPTQTVVYPPQEIAPPLPRARTGAGAGCRAPRRQRRLPRRVRSRNGRALPGVRRSAGRHERLAAPRRDPAGGRGVVDRGSRLDERNGGERAACRPDTSRGRRSDPHRRNRPRLQPHRVVTAAIEVEEALLVLKIGFLVLLYLFIWMIVRSATRDVRTAPQESIILSASEASALRADAGIPAPAQAPPAARGTLIVVGALRFAPARRSRSPVRRRSVAAPSAP